MHIYYTQIKIKADVKLNRAKYYTKDNKVDSDNYAIVCLTV